MFWASGGQAHSPNSNKATKNLVDGDLRRETNRSIYDIEQQLRKINPMELERNGFKITVPFSMPLPGDLPPSLFYCGEMMSRFSIEYRLTAMLIGLSAPAAKRAAIPQG